MQAIDYVEAQPVYQADLSYWLSTRKAQTDQFVPDPRWAKEFFGKPHIWYPWAFNVNPQQTNEYAQVIRENSWLISVTGFSNQSEGYQARILHVRRRRQIQRLFADQDLVVGTGQHPYFIREPYRVRRGDSIIVAIKNVSTNPLIGQLVMEAVEDVQQPI